MNITILPRTFGEKCPARTLPTWSSILIQRLTADVRGALHRVVSDSFSLPVILCMDGLLPGYGCDDQNQNVTMLVYVVFIDIRRLLQCQTL